MAAVVEAAAQILEDRGLAALNTNAIAARAGVSIGSLYQYFPGKEAIVAALIRREGLRFEAALAGVETYRGLPDALRALIAAGVVHQTGRPQLSRLLDLEEMRLGLADSVERTAQAATARIANVLADYGVVGPQTAAKDSLNLSRGMIDGDLKADPHDLSARIARAVFGYLGVDLIAAPQSS